MYWPRGKQAPISLAMLAWLTMFCSAFLNSPAPIMWRNRSTVTSLSAAPSPSAGTPDFG